MLHRAVTYDQLEVAQLAAFELLAGSLQLVELKYKDRFAAASSGGGAPFEDSHPYLGLSQTRGALMVCPALERYVGASLKDEFKAAEARRKAREERQLRKPRKWAAGGPQPGRGRGLAVALSKQATLGALAPLVRDVAVPAGLAPCAPALRSRGVFSAPDSPGAAPAGALPPPLAGVGERRGRVPQRHQRVRVPQRLLGRERRAVCLFGPPCAELPRAAAPGHARRFRWSPQGALRDSSRVHRRRAALCNGSAGSSSPCRRRACASQQSTARPPATTLTSTSWRSHMLLIP